MSSISITVCLYTLVLSVPRNGFIYVHESVLDVEPFLMPSILLPGIKIKNIFLSGATFKNDLCNNSIGNWFPELFSELFWPNHGFKSCQVTHYTNKTSKWRHRGFASCSLSQICLHTLCKKRTLIKFSH